MPKLRVAASRSSGFRLLQSIATVYPGCKVYLPALCLRQYPRWNPCMMSNLGCAGIIEEDMFVGGDARADRRQSSNGMRRSNEVLAIKLANARLCTHGCSRQIIVFNGLPNDGAPMAPQAVAARISTSHNNCVASHVEMSCFARPHPLYYHPAALILTGMK